jgi:hypothetical protein
MELRIALTSTESLAQLIGAEASNSLNNRVPLRFPKTSRQTAPSNPPA